MVFVHRNETAEQVAAKLAHHQIAVANLHAAADKRDRQQAMEDIRSGRVSVLIASDVAARGLDIAGIATVVNFDVPTQSKAYLHRVGRTARAGAKGRAMTLMTADELRLIPRFESELGIAMRHVRLREGRVIDAGEEGVSGPRGPADHPSPRSLVRRKA
jgi:superfamily II DNA/RNA helicase